MALDLGLIGQYRQQIWSGFVVTLKLSAGVLAGGTVIALALALARESRHRSLAMAAAVYVNLFRAVPALVVLYFTFYALPQ
jgi:polar amino acid transport system permease protein